MSSFTIAPTPATPEQAARLTELMNAIANDEMDFLGAGEGRVKVTTEVMVSVKVAMEEHGVEDPARVMRNAAFILRNHYGDTLGARKLSEVVGRVRHGLDTVAELIEEGSK